MVKISDGCGETGEAVEKLNRRKERPTCALDFHLCYEKCDQNVQWNFILDMKRAPFAIHRPLPLLEHLLGLGPPVSEKNFAQHSFAKIRLVFLRVPFRLGQK